MVVLVSAQVRLKWLNIMLENIAKRLEAISGSSSVSKNKKKTNEMIKSVKASLVRF